MNFLDDVITYVRRIIKSPSDATITDNLIIDYINRFWIMDVDARLQLFDLKSTYVFQTIPGVDQYNMPLYTVQTEGSDPTTEISLYPVYQGFLDTVQVNGNPIPFFTQKGQFFNLWPNYTQPLDAVAVADGGAIYDIQLPVGVNSSGSVNIQQSGILRGHVDMSGVIATGSNESPIVASSINTAIPTTSIFSSVYFTTTDGSGQQAVVQDSGQFLDADFNYGMLLRPGSAPFGNLALSGGYSITLNTINYNTGAANVTFTDGAGNPLAIPAGQNINAQVQYFSPGMPVGALFYNNVITLRTVPDKAYKVALDAYRTPAAFMTTSDILPFAYMGEYIARGAARKILADTGDTEQFSFYEPLFKEQEMLVWKRSQRQFTATRTPTIYSQSLGVQETGNSTSTGI